MTVKLPPGIIAKRKRRKTFEFLSRTHGKDREAAMWLMRLEHRAKNSSIIRRIVNEL